MLERPQNRWAGIFREAAGTTVSFVKGQTIIALILTAIYAVGLGLAGVPWWPLVALFCGFAHFVPFVGTLLSLLAPLTVVLLSGGSLWQGIFVLCVFVFAEGLEGFVLTPKILGDRLSMSPILVFFAVLLGSFVFGILGAVFAPLALALFFVVWKGVKGPPRSPAARYAPPTVPLTPQPVAGTPSDEVSTRP